jgi:Ca2+-binding EF-hand superfamily protein
MRVGRYDNLPRDIESSLANLISTEVEQMRLLSSLKNQLNSRGDFSPRAVYRAIDRYNVGNINGLALSSFLRAQGHSPAEMDLLAIIRRIDTEGNATITYKELEEFLAIQSDICPQPGDYMAPDAN